MIQDKGQNKKIKNLWKIIIAKVNFQKSNDQAKIAKIEISNFLKKIKDWLRGSTKLYILVYLKGNSMLPSSRDDKPIKGDRNK